MESKTNPDVDKLITFGQMALEQGWCDQELDYFDNVKLHKCAIRLGTSTTRITTDCTEGDECRSVYPCQNPCCAYRWPNLALSS